MPEIATHQRLALANLHALAQATLRSPESEPVRAYLASLAGSKSPRPPLSPGDPRADGVLAAGIHPVSAARRAAAKLRGAILGAAAHDDTARREVTSLARVAADGDGLRAKDVDARALAAYDITRDDLARGVVRLGPVPVNIAGEGAEEEAWVRRLGAVRSLELHGFVATFTRDGTDARATSVTREGDDAQAFRFVLAVAEAGLSLAKTESLDPALRSDVALVEATVEKLVARLVASSRAMAPR